MLKYLIPSITSSSPQTLLKVAYWLLSTMLAKQGTNDCALDLCQWREIVEFTIFLTQAPFLSIELYELCCFYYKQKLR